MNMNDLTEIKEFVRTASLYLEGDFSNYPKIHNFLKSHDGGIHLKINNFKLRNHVKLTIERKNVITVLKKFISDETTLEDVNLWGEFVRHELFINFNAEDLVLSEVIDRLESIGDSIDGEFTKKDAEFYLMQLQKSPV